MSVHEHFKLKSHLRYLAYRAGTLSLCLIACSVNYTYATPPGMPILIERWEALDSFFHALEERERGSGLVRITHIGDSHIIADFWTGEMRERLQRRFGDGGRGFVLGGKMWRSYSQRHVYHRSEGAWEVTNLKRGRDSGVFGPGGAALICADESCRTYVETRHHQRASVFDQLDVFTFGHSQGGEFALYVDDQLQGITQTFSPWLTVNRHRFSLDATAHQVTLHPIQRRGEVWLFGFSLANSQGGLIYDSIGLNGAQAKHLLKNSDENLRRGLSLLDAQLLVISFGINEVFDRGYQREAYRYALDSVLAAIRSPVTGSDLHTRPCLLTGPFAALRRGAPPQALNEVYKIQRELSARYGCALWDARTAMGGDIRPWQRAKLARRDGVHLSRHGYRRIAELFEESLMMTWNVWRQRTQAQSLSRTP